jgi:hypothetical protein
VTFPTSLLDPLRRSRLYHLLRPLVERWELSRWERRGRRTRPPHLFKSRVVSAYAKRFGPRVLVETGTYLGSMALDVREVFAKIHTIELDPLLGSLARRRLAPFVNVHVHLGDSAALLPGLLAAIHEPALFWLDAHHSGGMTARGPLETPVRGEIHAIIAGAVDPVVLIDDADLFDGRGDYPTLDEVEAGLSKRWPRLAFDVEDGIARAVCR